MAQMLTSAKGLDSAWKDMSSEGGRARAARYSGEVLSEWASRGGQAVFAKYGPDYFVQLRKRRKNYPKYSESSFADCERSPLIQIRRTVKNPAWPTHATSASASDNGDGRGAIENHGDQAQASSLARRVLAARQNGSLGGKQSSLNLDPEQRETRARMGGNAILNRYGRDYYSYLGKLSRKASTTTPTKSALDTPPKISVSARRFWALAAAIRQ